MKILGIETSCDETAAAVVENGTKLLSNIVSSSLPLHSKTGGIIPEIAAREQNKAMIPVLEETLKTLDGENVDAIAVTFGPGLIGSLLVGVETAKTLSFVWNKPLIPVNHLIGHIYASRLESPVLPKFPLVALIVSGGHTELLHVQDHGKFEHLGGTRDDAAGEAFDKAARILGLGYPGGPLIEEKARNGNSRTYNLPRPMINTTDYDFSYSGLKTALLELVSRLNQNSANHKLSPDEICNVAASFQEAVVDSLVSKTIRAAKNANVKTIVLGGGVAANTKLKEKLRASFSGNVCTPEPKFAVDNAAMIASAAFFNFKPVSWRKVFADASILF